MILLIYSLISIALTAYVSAGHGRSAVIVLIALFFFESLMFATIFVLGTANLGHHSRRGAGILVMGVSGGALFPPIQGAIADAYSTRISFLVPMVGFIFVLAYALFHWWKNGFLLRPTRTTVDIQDKSDVEQKTVSTAINRITTSTIMESENKRADGEQVIDMKSHFSKAQPNPAASKTYTNKGFLKTEHF